LITKSLIFWKLQFDTYLKKYRLYPRNKRSKRFPYTSTE
jgi:hypothetical protein